MSHEFDLDYLCQLAHLLLEPEEKSKLKPQLEEIVAWVGKLKELELAVVPKEAEEELKLALRPDKVESSIPLNLVLQAAPEKDDFFIKVPKVIEER
ncbi:MAG: Asp-tRNA(Asn)/Glu-tRNA(Gln) amidotransferase subunit GatC [Candidatus Aminicenantes bacterium]|nr:Asp-tRNA(Asn)/Glu-tRNA(Gln) amidotransferase subunit GatC [Candidatus Aminicenantes bacterium]